MIETAQLFYVQLQVLYLLNQKLIIFMKKLSLKVCIETAESLGLKEITTQTQKNHGTYMFRAENGDKFGIYLKSGYIRRHYTTTSRYRSYEEVSYMYPLNPRTKGSFPGLTYKIFPGDHNTLFNMLFKRFQ
jgi:hypothetical protein